jgi:hypothetical protein
MSGAQAPHSRRSTTPIYRVLAGVALVVALAAAACTPTPRTPRPDTPVPPAGDALLPAHLDCLRWRYDGLTATRPTEWDEDGEYRFGSFRDETTADSPHRLCGQVGAAADLAWSIDRGRPDVVVAVLDSGVMWRNAEKMADLADKTYINAAELPTPIPAGAAGDPDDSNGDGRFTVTDFGADPRVTDWPSPTGPMPTATPTSTTSPGGTCRTTTTTPSTTSSTATDRVRPAMRSGPTTAPATTGRAPSVSRCTYGWPTRSSPRAAGSRPV